MAIAGFALFVLGLILVIIAPINRKKNARCSEQTEGILKKILERENSDGPLPDMYVYSYEVNGTEYEIRSTIRGKEAHATGDSCTIWYNPAKPKDAQPFRYESGKIYTIILLIGIGLILLGILLTLLGLGRPSV